MSRLGLLHPSTLTGKHTSETRALYSTILQHLSTTQPSTNPLITTTTNTTNATTSNTNTHPHPAILPSTGALTGPYGILLHTPALGHAYLSLLTALHSTPPCTILPARLRSLLTLTVAVLEAAPFATYSAQTTALSYNILTKPEIQAIRAGQCPPTLDLAETAAWQMVVGLCDGRQQRGPLEQRRWDAVVGSWGGDVAVAVVHWVAVQRAVCTLERGFDARVPPEGERVGGF